MNRYKTVTYCLFVLITCAGILSYFGNFSSSAQGKFGKSGKIEKSSVETKSETLIPADLTPQTIPFFQNWSNAGLITTNDDWSGVPGIIGYRGDDFGTGTPTTTTGVDPQTIVADMSTTPVNVIANQSNPNTLTTGGVAEFDGIANPVVALQGSGTADAPHIVLNLNTTSYQNIKISYLLRDIDASVDNAVQPVALQYRVGTTGSYTNIPAGFVADASAGPSLTLDTLVSVTLPAAVNNQPVVQIRIITANAAGSDEWIGIDNISVAASLIISEFRVRGPSGQNDEFIEIYNPHDTSYTINSSDGSAGFGIAASDGVIRCTIPNGTVMPPRGHYLCVNTAGYSLTGYPAGNGTTATGDATYTTNIPDNAGIAIFNTANTAAFSTGTRLDAVGSTSEANTLYREGSGYTAITPFSVDASLYRDEMWTGNNVPQIDNGCNPFPKDTDTNTQDFLWVDTNGTNAGFGQRLGAPGPQNLSSPLGPTFSSGGFGITLLDPSQPIGASPNFVRDFTSDPPNNSTFGTIDIRRTFTNNTGVPITRLRFRVTQISTFPSPGGIADLRPRSSTAIIVPITGTNPACPGNVCFVQGTTLEEAFVNQQINGGGFNSSMSAGTVTLAQPLPAGASINLRFLFGIQQTGAFDLGFNLESLPVGSNASLWAVSGGTDSPAALFREPCSPALAANVSVGGRVTDQKGNGLSRVSVTISGGELDSPVTVLTNSFGAYNFLVPVGQTYFVTVGSRRYSFVPETQVVTANDSVNNADFVGEEQ